MKHISLFSGIGGFDLAAEWVGWENLASCEIADFPRKVLQYHFPKSYHHDDIHTLNYEKLDYELKKRFGDQWRSDDIVLSGGFPCQPYSIAGKQLGKNDSRHLWPEMLRVIREIKPTWVVGENVRGLISWNAGLVFDEVQSDLEAEGYCVQAFVLPAAGLNAPHRRDRVWFVAYSGGTRTGDKGREFNGQGRESGSNRKPSIYENGAVGASGHNTASANDGITKNTNHDGWGSEFGQKESSERQFGNTCSGNNEPISSNDAEIRLTPDTHGERYEECDSSSITTQQKLQQYSEKYSASTTRRWEKFPTTEPTIRGGDDGLSGRLDGITFSKWRNESIKAYGNAVVPQVVLMIFKAIEEYRNKNQF